MTNRYEISKEARQLHYSSFVADLHTDTLLWDSILGYNLLKRHTNPLPCSPLIYHADIPRMKEGGISLQALGLVTNYWWRKKKSAMSKVLRLHEIIGESADMEWALSGTEAEETWKRGKIGAFVGMEGCQPLEGKLENLQWFHDNGVRYISLTHFNTTEAGYPSIGKSNRQKGLTNFGIDLIAAMEEKRIMLDLAHLSYQGYIDALHFSRNPVLVTHTAINNDAGHPRALDAKRIKAIAANGGVIGIIFSPWFLSRKIFESAERIVDHIDLVKQIVGIDYVAIGSDFDGFIHLPKGIKGVNDLPVLTQLMLERNYSDEEIRKVLGMNFLRVYKQVCG